MILKDVRFMREMEKKISEGMSPAAAIRAVGRHYMDLFSTSDHAHVREKANDVQDLAGRILKNMSCKDEMDQTLVGNRIVIARELYPSDILRLASENVKGIILVSGGVTYGHRFLAPEPLEITDAASYLPSLKAAHVIADIAERRSLLTAELNKAAAQVGGEVVPNPGLVEENNFLVEFPSVVCGHFEDEFLALPDDGKSVLGRLLETAMLDLEGEVGADLTGSRETRGHVGILPEPDLDVPGLSGKTLGLGGHARLERGLDGTPH